MKRTSKKLGVKIEKRTDIDFDEKEIPDTKKSEIEEVEADNTLHKICVILDNLCLDALSLMERLMERKLDMEKLMTDGELHLAKSRYIMGQRSVSALQLPTEKENTSAVLTITEVYNEDKTVSDKPYLKLEENCVDNNDEKKNIRDPLKWFGVLVPQDLKAAQCKYKLVIDIAVECSNIQIQLHELYVKIKQLKQLKTTLKKDTKG